MTLREAMAPWGTGCGVRLRAFSCCAALGQMAACGNEEAVSPPDRIADASTDAGGPPDADAGDAASEPLTLAFEPIELDPDVDWITDFAFLPNGELLLATKTGLMHHVALDGDATELLGSFALGNVHDVLDCGLISLALDPGFDENGFFYIGQCTSLQSSGVFRYRFDASGYEAIASTQALIVETSLSSATQPWHNVGALDFDAEGNLYVLFGEKTSGAQSQDLSNNLGTLLRIVPSRDPESGGYAPSPGNPFAGDADRSPDIYAYGLRSPWRGALDARGRFWFGDVGSDFFEEINVVTEPGQNFGWPIAEGPCSEDCAELLDPVTYWGRSGDHPYLADDPGAAPTGARVAWVGPEYRPMDRDRYQGRLSGRVLFGEYCVGFVRAAALGDDGVLVEDEPLGHIETAPVWRQGPDGYLYAASVGRCQTDRESPRDAPSRLLRAVPAP